MLEAGLMLDVGRHCMEVLLELVFGRWGGIVIVVIVQVTLASKICRSFVFVRLTILQKPSIPAYECLLRRAEHAHIDIFQLSR